MINTFLGAGRETLNGVIFLCLHYKHVQGHHMCDEVWVSACYHVKGQWHDNKIELT